MAISFGSGLFCQAPLTPSQIVLHSIIQFDIGFEYIEIYEGGSEYAELEENITGIYKQINVSVPSNQMFVKFVTSSKVARKGFSAFIHRIGKLLLKLFKMTNIDTRGGAWHWVRQ